MWTLSGIIRLIAGILGLKVDAHSFFFSLGVTLLTFIGLLLAKPAQQNLAIGWGIVANAISFLGAHVLQNGGFKWVKRTQYEQPVWRIHWKNVGKNFGKVLPTPQNILRYSQQKVAKHGSRPSVLAIFCCLIYVIPYLLWLPEQKGYTTDFLVIRLVGGSLCVFLLAKDYWPTWLKPYFPVCWHLSLLYCLPLVATLAYLLMGGNTAVWFTNITLSMLVLALLVDWLSFALLSVVGMVLGIALYLGMVYGFSIEMHHLKEATAIYLIMYVCITIAFIASTLARRKEEAIEADKQLIKLYAADIAHDLNNTIGSMRLFASGIASFLKYAPIQEQTDDKGKKAIHFLPVYMNLSRTYPTPCRKRVIKGIKSLRSCSRRSSGGV